MKKVAIILCLNMAIAIGLIAQNHPAPQKARPPLSKLQRLRLERQWFATGRRSPDKKSLAWHLLQAQRQARRIPYLQRPVRSHANGVAATSQSPAWNFEGPQAIDTAGAQDDGYVSGIVSAIAVDLNNDPSGNTIYVGTTYGGVWKTTNALSSSPIFTPLTDGAPSLDIGAIALGPDNAAGQPMLYVGTGKWIQDFYQGVGLMESSDGGVTWTLISSADNGAEQFAGLSITSILVDPQNPQILLMSTALTNDSNLNGLSSGYNATSNNLPGIYHSSDGGQTWSLGFIPPGTSGADCSQIVYDASTHTYYAAFLGYGFYASSDQGATWNTLADPFANQAPISSSNFEVVSLAAQNGKLYALIADGSGGLGNLSMPTPCANPSAANPGNCDTGLVVSGNGGQSWTALPVPSDDLDGVNALFCEPGSSGTQCQGIYDQFLGLTPDGNTLVLGGLDVWALDLATQTYTQVTQGYGGYTDKVHSDQHAIAFASSSDWFVGNDGGIWSSNDAGGTGQSSDWVNMNATLGATTFYSATQVLDANSLPILAGGAQDDGTDFQAAGLQWQQQIWGDGGFTQYVPQNAQQYTFENDGGYLGATSTTDAVLGMSTIVDQNTITDWQNYAPLVFPYQFEPSNSKQLLVGGDCRIWRGPYANTTASQGQADPNWQAISNDLSSNLSNSDCGQMQGIVIAITEAPSSADTIYAGTSNGLVWVTTNATCSEGSTPSCPMPTWTEVDGGGLPSDPVSSIAVAAANPQLAVIGMMGFGHGHVYLTSDGGGNWTDISGTVGSGGLPDAPVNTLLIDPSNPKVFYAGTDVGVFVATDGGAGGSDEQWNQLGPGLPNVPIIQLQYSEDQTQLIAASFGRGAWMIPVLGGSNSSGPDFSLSASPESQTATGATVTITIATAAIDNDTAAINLSCTKPSSGCNFSPASVTPGGNSTLTLSLSALTPGWNDIEISGTDGTNTHSAGVTVFISGSSAVTLSPASINFGNQAMDTVGAPQTVTLTNSGTGFLYIYSIAFQDSQGNTTNQYIEINNCPNILAPGANCQIQVSFEPDGIGMQSSELQISDDAGNQTVSLIGTAPAPTGSWIPLNPPGNSPSGWDEIIAGKGDTLIAYDSLNGNVHVLSNADGQGNATSWWTQLTPANSAPPPQFNFSMAYDPAGNNLIVFGGIACSWSDGSLGNCSANNWIWVLSHANGSGGTPTWTLLAPSGAQPPPRENSVAAYDAANNRLIVYGGDDGNSQIFNDVWVLTNANGTGGTPTWTNLNPAGAAPQNLDTPGAFYDAIHNRLIVTGGNSSGNNYFTNTSIASTAVWQLSNANGMGGSPAWTQTLSENSPGAPNVNVDEPYWDSIFSSGTVYDGAQTAWSVIAGQLWKLTNANGTAPAWSVAPYIGLPMGNTYMSQLIYNPTSGVITDIMNGQVYILNLKGTPANTQILTPLNLYLGNYIEGQLIKTTSAAQHVTLVNYTPAAITLNQIAIQGANGPDFAVAANGTSCAAGGILAPNGGACAVAVHFTPSTGTEETASLNISDSAGTLHSVRLNGVGTTLKASTYVLNFGNQSVNSTSAAQSVTISNIGTMPVVYWLGFDSGINYTESDNCGSSLAAGASCTVTVAFTPTYAGPNNDALLMGGGSTGRVLNIQLLGTGTSTTSKAMISPSSLNFSDQVINTSSAPQIVMLSNAGGAAMSIASIAASSGFTQSNNCGATLTAGQTCAIWVTFTPSQTGALTGTLTISDNDASSPQTVPLSGNGIDPVATLSPTALTFTQALNAQGAAQTVTITNSGTSILNIYSVYIEGDYRYFDKTDNCERNATLSPGASCQFQVSFTPGGIGTYAATLYIYDNAVNSPQTVSLTGTTPAATGTWNLLTTSDSIPEVDTGTNNIVAAQGDTLILYGAWTGDIMVLSHADGLGGVSVWTKLTPSGNAPAPRSLSALAYDATGNNLIVFGGNTCLNNCDTQTPTMGNTNDVWVLSNANGSGGAPIWTQLQPSGTPPSPRDNSVAEYDAANNRLIIFGGDNFFNQSINDTWVLTNANGSGGTPAWIQLNPSGQAPQNIDNPGAFYDSVNNQLVVIGGGNNFLGINNANISNAVWKLSNANGQGGTAAWTQTLAKDSPSAPNISTYDYWDGISKSGTIFDGSQTAWSIIGGQLWKLSDANGATPIWSVAPYIGMPNYSFMPRMFYNPTSGIITDVLSENSYNSSTHTYPFTIKVYTLSPKSAPAAAEIVTPTALLLGDTEGNQILQTTSTSQHVTLANYTDNPITISQIAITNSANNDFTIQANGTTCAVGGTLAANGGTCSVAMQFTSSTIDEEYASLNITDQNGNHGIFLIGNGTALQLSTNTLAYGNQVVNTTSPAQTFTITNKTNNPDPIHLSIVTYQPFNDSYAENDNCGASLAAGASCTVSVYFTPSQSGTIYGYLGIAENGMQWLNLYAWLCGTGIPPAPQAGLSPGTLSFNNQPVNITSAAQAVTLANTGYVALNLVSIAASGDFAETNNCGTTLSAGANCTISVTFKPTQTGARTGTLTITDNATDSPQTVALSGTGVAPAVTLTPTPLPDFGSVLVGQTSAAQTLTLSNSGTAALTISGITASGDYAVTNTCSGSLAAEANCSISVTFKPTQTGARTGTLTITDNATNSPQTVQLSGTGIAPAAALSPTTLPDFGSVLVGQTSAAQTLTLTNSGTATLTISGITASGDYAATNTCNGSLAAGTNCSISVTFTPTQTGARTGTLTIADDAAGSPQTVALSGTGLTPAAAVLSQASLSFGSQATDTTSPAQTVVLSNPGQAPLAISSIAISGDFAQTNNCGTSVAAGASCLIDISFKPSATGNRTGTLTVSDNAPGSPQTVALAGSGITPGITLSPNVLTFGGTAVNATATLGLTITNNGSADLHISGMSASGDFAVTGNCGTIPAGSSCSVNVNFTPTATGTRTGTVTLSDDAPDSPQSVPVSGTGVAPGVQISPSTIDFPDTIVNSNSYPITATLANASTVALTGITISASGDYTETNNCPASLAGAATTGGLGQSCQIQIIFKPSLTGADAGSLTISDNAGEQTVALVGEGLAPGASLSVTQLNFGGQSAGTTSPAQTVVLANTGTSALSISSVAMTAGFNLTTSCVDNSGSGSLAASSSCPLNVNFSPTSTGPQTGTLTIHDTAGTQTVGLSGTGNTTGLAIAPSTLTFGAEEVNTTSDSQTLTITNTGTTALTLKPISITGDFQSMSTCPTSTGGLTAGGNCSVNISFTPTAAGTRTGTLTVSDSTGATTASAVLEGTGSLPGISTAPGTLFFGGTIVGSTSANQTITVTNTGSSPLIISTVAVSGDFTESNTCTSTSIAAGQNCVISVAMAPTTVGNETGAIEIYDNADGLHAVALSGVGITGASLLPATLSFGSQPIPGANSTGITLTGATQNVVLTNISNTALALSGLTIQSPFSQTNDCGSSLAAGASCTLAISFAPQMEGQATGSLNFTDASGATESVALNGYGSPNGLTMSPSTLNFGTQAIGQTSTPQTTTLTNNTGQGISSLVITASGEFSQTNDCNGALANGASCTLTISLQPATSGTITGAIAISGVLSGSSASNRLSRMRPHYASGSVNSSGLAEIALVGSGNAAGVSLSANSVSFANQAIGTSSATQTVTLTNSGQANLTGVSITVAGDFSQTNTCGTSVATGANCTISVTFSPTTNGTRTGTLSIADSATGSPQTVSLVGIGFTPAPTAALSSPSAFAGQTVGTTSGAQSLTLSNSGTAALDLTSIDISGDFAQTNNCGTSVAAGANCTIQVTFTPTAGGTRSGTLTVTDNASGSPQSVALTGTGEDFSLGVASGGSGTATINAGATATYSLSVTPQGGYSQAVSFSCSGAPNLATCSISPASVTLDGSHIASLSVTVTTTAGTSLPALPQSPNPPSFTPVWLLLAGLGLVLLGCVYRNKMRLARALPIAGMALLLAYAVGCGGSPGPVVNHTPGTQAGTYSLSVTGTSGNLQHTTTLTLTVQ